MTQTALAKAVPKTTLFRDKRFLFLWTATIFSAFSRTMFMFSEAWYIVRILDLRSSIAFIFIASSIPTIFFMLIGGVAADRISRSKIMFLSEALRAVLIGALAVFLISSDLIGLWLFVGIALIFGILNAFFGPARDSLIPYIVEEEQLTRANSLIQTTTQMAAVFGPVFAGAIIVWKGYAAVFAFTALALAIGSLFALAVKAPVNERTEDGMKQLPMWHSIMEGWHVIRGSAFLKAEFAISITINMVFTGPVMVGLPLFVDEVLHGTTLDYSGIEGSLSFGMVIGAVVMSIVNIKRKRGLFAMLALVGLSLTYLVFSLSGSIPAAMGLLFILGVFMQCVNIPLISAIQSMVEKRMIGRMMSMMTVSAIGLTPVSFALTSLLLSLGLAADTIMTASAIPLVLLVLFVFWKVPAMRKMD
ncbi:MAG TPA: MFS transporter [Bacillales bacterium]|nr:MFS transporter [Bacillales bacterium]